MGKKKDGVNFNSYLVLLVIVLLCTIVSYFVAPGAYEREKINGLNVVIADSYHPVPRTPVSFLEMYRSIPKGLEGAATMMFVVMIIGGVVEVYNRTGAIGAGIKSLLQLSRKISSQWILAVVMGRILCHWRYFGMVGTDHTFCADHHLFGAGIGV